ncbi:acyl dehydratase [Sphingoaurantiacus capsulatus]|uniref:Acyl dehydratase n=1 Tax=Sphingoaurantiacus capsulatus TaxID=1771310 RepID=A0ABV7XBW9_9SPHN
MRWFEDHRVGDRAAFGRYAVTQAEIDDFAARYDPATAGGAASTWLVSAIMVRIVVDHFTAAGSAAIGSPGFDGLRWLEPVHAGDVLRVEEEVTEIRPSRSRTDIGSVNARVTVLNQRDQPVMTIGTISLVRRRPA